MSQAIQQLQDILKENKNNGRGGVYSVCCSNEHVITAALEYAKDKDYPLIIESTSNQVNQFGGYTGMNPQDYAHYVYMLADTVGYPKEHIVLGGDHLGPNAWQNERAESAMEKSEQLVADYIKAGYRKIHLDASMPCSDDIITTGIGIGDEIVAQRAARLCAVAEYTWNALEEKGESPVYIIGTEVPVPGGSSENEEIIHPTKKEDAKNTYTITKKIFLEKNLSTAWERVVAMVVQPGVEFSDDNVFFYNSKNANELSMLSNEFHLVFEAHSTDYQKKDGLKALVADHYAILKVGPWLTYAYREALFALSHIEKEMYTYKLLDKPPSRFIEKMATYLDAHTEHWEKYYHGTHDEIAYKCLYSLSDRIRYYWDQEYVKNLVASLLANLQGLTIPFSLASQYMPHAVDYVALKNMTADTIIKAHITHVLSIYEHAIL